MPNTTHADKFAVALNEKFANQGPFSMNKFSVMPGQRFSRVVQESEGSSGKSVHAFVENATGHVYKASGWKAPAKGVRYASVEEAAAAADVYGSYLYVR